MAKKTNSRLIGGFVVGAIALAVIGAIAFGGGKYFAAKEKAVMFFTEESLAGLGIGSPVTFRGVKIGSVTDVIIRYDVDQQVVRIPVYVEIDLDRIQIVSGQRNVKNVQALVQKGLRGQLVVQSLVTGQTSVDLNFHPNTPIKLVGAVPDMLEMPTIPSEIDILKANLSGLLAKISELPLNEIATQLAGTVGASKEFMTNLNAQLGPLSEQATATLKEVQSRLELREGEPLQNINATLADTRELVNNIDGRVASLTSDVNKMVRSVLATLDSADATLSAAQGTISPDSPLYFQMNSTLREIQSMATSIRAFMDYVQRNPNALLTGK